MSEQLLHSFGKHKGRGAPQKLRGWNQAWWIISFFHCSSIAQNPLWWVSSASCTLYLLPGVLAFNGYLVSLFSFFCGLLWGMCSIWGGSLTRDQSQASAAKAAAAPAAKSLQSCPTLCDPVDGSPPGSPIPGTLQARTLEWVAISCSNAWKSEKWKWSCSVVSDS